MSRLLDAIAGQAGKNPQGIAIEGINNTLSYGELSRAIAATEEFLGRHDIHIAALMADNGPSWCLLDLACLRAGIPLLPIPHFFSPGQIRHLIHSSAVDAVLTEQPGQVMAALEQLQIDHARPIEFSVAGLSLCLIQLTRPAQALQVDYAKVTFTSGSTGEPKGVCLHLEAMETVAESLADAIGACSDDRHLSLLPYATLLENIGGLYAPLLSGATVLSPPLSAVGLSGASGLDVKRFVGMLNQSGATSCIMIPQMLHALVAAVEAGAAQPKSLRFIAVGGAPVSELLLARAEKLGLPVYEGYGLSEASSVVAVNRPGACKRGSVGKLLAHAEVKLSNEGEILVGGGLFAGYLGETTFTDAMWPTGDIGYLDDEGFLHLSGRKKHIFITAFGRNVSPEWVESELSIEPAIAQCCVFGEARPFNVAVIVPRPGIAADLVQLAIDTANARLPDYASVSSWLIADEPFGINNGMWTGTGRPRRQQIFSAYAANIERLYEES